MTDNQAPFEHTQATDSAGTASTSVSVLARAGGHVIPKACTLKTWKGIATGSGTSDTVTISLFKWTPVRNDSSTVAPVLLDAVAFTALGNTKVETISETSFTQASVDAGDIIVTQVKTGTNGTVVYFNTTLEVEF